MADDKPRVGFVGVGRMGGNMAHRLHDLGYPIAGVVDVGLETARKIAGEVCAPVATSLAGLTADSDVVFTVVTDDRSMRAVFLSDGDSLLRNASGTLFINCATVSPRIHVDVERAAGQAGAQSLEACMASSITQAREGTLYLMCGGTRQAFDRAEPLLRDLSSNMRYIGHAGQAAQVKALVNMVMNINTAGLAEGLGLGEALGLDLMILQEVFGETGAASRVLETDGEDMQMRDHECYFSAAHAAKDSGIALDLASGVGLDLPLSTVTKAQYDHMVDLGKGGMDKSGVAELTFKGRGLQ